VIHLQHSLRGSDGGEGREGALLTNVKLKYPLAAADSLKAQEDVNRKQPNNQIMSSWNFPTNISRCIIGLRRGSVYVCDGEFTDCATVPA